MLRRREGSLLILVLVVMLAVSAVVGGLQYLAVTTVRQTQYSLSATDALFRVEGVLHLLISRWKKEIQYLSDVPLTSPASGSAEGHFDGLPYVYGWERQALETHPPTYRMSVWVRFTTEKPLRTFRWDVTLRTPSALEPQILDVQALGIDDLDPSKEASRKKAFAALVSDEKERRRHEADLEVLTTEVRHVARSAKTAGELREKVASSALSGHATILEQYLEVFEVLQKAAVGARMEHAEKLVGLAKGLPAQLQFPWLDLARFHLSREFLERARNPAFPDRQGSLQRAISELKEIVARDPESCGAVKSAWKLAQLVMIMRPDPQIFPTLDQAKKEAQALLRTVVDRSPRSPIHERTNIERRELSGFFDGLWRARVAASIKVPRTDGTHSYMLVSMREDGAYPVVHLESASPVRPLVWQVDGSEICAVSELAQGTSATSSSYQTIWRVNLDGSEVLDIGATGGILAHVIDLELSSEGKSFAAMGLTESPIVRYFRSGLIKLGQGFDWEKWIKDMRTTGFYEKLSVAAVRGDKQVSFTFSQSPGLITPIAFSPEADRVMVITNMVVNDRKIRVYSSNDFFRESSHRMIAPDLPTAELEAMYSRYYPDLQTDPRFDNSMWKYIDLRLRDVRNATITGLSWLSFGSYPGYGHWGWIGVAAVRPDYTQIYFTYTSPYYAYSLPPIRMDVKTAPIDGSTFLESAKIGTLVQKPPGYVLAGTDRLHYTAIPGWSYPMTAAEWPKNYLGQLSDIRHLEAPPWGGVLFFIAKLNGSPEDKLFVLDMLSGEAQILIGAPGGAWPASSAASRLAVSPIPDPSLTGKPLELE